MNTNEKGLWALVRMGVIGGALHPISVLIGADRTILEGLADPYRDWIVPAGVDWPSLDPQEEETICVKSAV